MLSNKIVFTQKLLLTCSFLYLLSPCIIFLLSWVKLYVAFLSLVGLLPVFFYFLRIPTDKSLGLTVKELIQLLVISGSIVLLSGVGGFSDQICDYKGHSAKLHDLIVNPWPFQYKHAGQYPCYYFGYYLVPALISKINISASSIIWVLWTSMGLFLALSLTYLLVKKKITIVLAALVCSGGYTLAFSLNKKTIDSSYLTQWYAAFSPFDNAIWVPNQIIPSILCVITLLLCVQMRNYFVPVCMLACSFFWAPFPALIVSLLYFYYVLTNINHFIIDLKQTLISFLGLVVAFIPIVIYLSATSSGGVSTFVWNLDKEWLPLVIIYILVEIGFVTVLFYMLTRLKWSANTPLNTYFYIGFIIFPVLCLFKYGVCNDLMTRGVMPIMYLFALVVAYQVFYETDRIKKVIMVVCWLALSLYPIKNLYHQISHNVLLGDFWVYTPQEDMYDVLHKYYSKIEAEQYLLKKNSIFEKYLLKK